MRNKSKSRMFWELLSEDRALVFFVIAFIVWGIDLGAELGGINIESWVWIMSRILVPVLFVCGIILYVRKHYLLAKNLSSTKHLPVVFVVGRTGEEARNTRQSAEKVVSNLTGFRAFTQLEKSFPVSYENLIHHQRNRLSADTKQWQSYVADAVQSISRFTNAVPGNKVYHIFMYGPAALAFGLGAAFGVKYPMVVYQWTNGQYLPVINLMENVRLIKQHTPESEFRYIKTRFPENLTPDTAVMIDNASHSAVGDVRNYLNREGKQMSIVDVWNTYEGNLTESDWIPPVRELYSVFHKLQSLEETTRFHLFFTIPVAMAFGLGAALGHFVPITVYNLEPAGETYFPALRLNELDDVL